MPVKNMVIIVIVCGVLLIGGLTALIFPYYNNQYYAKRLIAAIEQEDVVRVRELTQSKFGNANNLPIINKYLAIFGEMEYSTPLQVACLKGNFEIVKLLIEDGADVNYMVSSMNMTSPLMLAACCRTDDTLKIIKLLVENGADMDYARNVETVMTLLAEVNHPQVIESLEYLESKGQNIYGRYPNGTLLHYACRRDNSLVINYLVVKRKVDVNAQHSNGQTPLMVLMFRLENIDDLKLLLEYGADKTVKDNEGLTAYDYAVDYEHAIAAEELLKLD